MPSPAHDDTLTLSDGAPLGYTLHPAPSAGAPRLVMVHSLALDRTIWDGIVERLQRDVEILTYDCRGHGRSGRGAGGYTAELFAHDLAELLDHVGWQSAAVAGCSMGGCVAQAFAGLHAGRATALGLVDTTAWYGPDAPVKWRERAAAARATGMAGLVNFQVSRWFSDEFRASEPALVARATEVFLANDVECYAATCALLGDADLRPYLASFHMRVAVLVGEDDYATPVAMARYLHESIAGSTLTILPRARHLTPVESPGEIASALLELIQAV